MAANVQPIYVKKPEVQWNATNITAANTAYDGTGTVVDFFVADAVEGSFCERIEVRARGTNVATVMRIFVNNGSTNTTAANNSLIAELPMAATTASQTASLLPTTIIINLPMPAGYKLFATIGTAVASGFSVTGIGGDY